MFLHGCNYPWSTDGTTVFYGLDFGANVWGSHLGVSTRRAAVARDMASMAALGFLVIRWFLFCDGRAGIVYDDRGLPSALAPQLFADVDAALEIARDAGVRIDFVLLDHHWMFAGLREIIADPITGALLEVRLPDGRAGVLRAELGRDRLFERIVEPFIRRYGVRGERADLGPSIAAVELMNEPDFVIQEWERDLSARVARPLPFEAFAGMVSRLSDLLHAVLPSALSTLGGARAHNLWAWDDDALGLDVLQVHVYPAGDDAAALPPASTLKLRRAVVLGEFPGALAADYLESALEGGYVGAWPWSFSGTDAHGRVPVEPLRRFTARHPGLVHPTARASLSAAAPPPPRRDA